MAVNSLEPPPRGINLFGVEWREWLAKLYRYVTENMSANYWLDEALGRWSNYSRTHKFGKSASVGTTFVPVCAGETYWTPTAATTLRAVSTDADDTSAGAGARTIVVQGLDANWALQTATITMAGTSDSSDTSESFIRVFRAWVATSGTYATASAASHQGEITIKTTAGTTVAKILTVDGLTTNGFGTGQTQIAAYTVPAGKKAILWSIDAWVDSTKTNDLVFFKRENADDVTSPYDSMRVVSEYVGIVSDVHENPGQAIDVFPAKTDIGIMARVSATTSTITANFSFTLADA